MKRILMLIIILTIFFPKNCRALSAKSYVVMDAENGRVLYSQNENEYLPMASTTKIMTALVAIENSSPDDTVNVSNNAANTEGSSIYLKAGEKVSMRELLYGLMLASGNDAAVAIAEHISGSEDEFAKKMTERAQSAGAFNTSFKNPNGLDADGHYTTAKDLALITREAMKNPLFAEIVKTKSIKLSRSTYTNHNKLLSMYEGITGVKTGFTKRCGRCLVSSCTRNGFSIIVVTLNDPNDWDDHIYLYDKAFSEYSYETIIKDGQNAGITYSEEGNPIGLIYKSGICAYISEQEKNKLKIINEVPEGVSLPVSAGDKIGTATLYIDNINLGTCDIVSEENTAANKKTFADYFLYTAKLWFSAF